MVYNAPERYNKMPPKVEHRLYGGTDEASICHVFPNLYGKSALRIFSRQSIINAPSDQVRGWFCLGVSQ